MLLYIWTGVIMTTVNGDNWCRPELGLQVSLRLGSVEGYGLST